MATKALALALAAALLPAAALGRNLTPIGTVLTGIAAGDRTRPLIDLMKQATAFTPVGVPLNAQNATVDANGWPTMDFWMSVIAVGGGEPMFQWPADTNVTGVYTIIAQGNATLGWSNATQGVTVLNSTYDAATNTFTAFVEMAADNSGFLEPIFTNTQRTPGAPLGSGLTNVSVIKPGYTLQDAQTQLFTNEFLAHIARFDTLRFLGWNLNTSQGCDTPAGQVPACALHWSDRVPFSQPSWLPGSYGTHGGGAPWEAILTLCKVTGADCWINLPAPVADDYILGLAQLINDMLPAPAKVVVQYSNEVWNGHFEGAWTNTYLANVSVTQDGDPYHFNYDTCNNGDTWAVRREAFMAKHVADIFKQVFPADQVGPNGRIISVMAGDGGYATRARMMFQYLSDVWGTPATLGLGAFTIAPYYGIPNAINNEPNPTVDEIIAGMNASIDSMDYAVTYNGSNALAAHVAIAAYYGIPFRGYEGGPASTGPQIDSAMLAKGLALNDTRQTALLERLWSVWNAYGLDQLNIFQAGATTLYCPWGSFGILYDMSFPVTPRTIALDYVRSQPKPAPSAGLPVPLLNHSSACYVGSYSPKGCEGPSTWLPVNTTQMYLLNNPAAATLNFSVLTATNLNGTLLELSLGAGTEQVLPVPNTGSMGAYSRATWAVFKDVPAGIITARLRVVTPQSYRIGALNVVPVPEDA